MNESGETKHTPAPNWVLHQKWLDRCNEKLARLPEDFGRKKWQEQIGELPNCIAGRVKDEPPSWSRLPLSARFMHVRKEAVQEICKSDHRKARWLFRAIFVVTALSVIALEWCAHMHPSPWLAGAYLLCTVGLLITYAVCVEKKGWFEFHLGGRALAEALRVQTQWNAVEIRQSVSDHYLHTHRTCLAQVRRAVRGWNLLSGAHQDRDEESEVLQIPERIAFVQEGWLRHSLKFFTENGCKFENWHQMCHKTSRLLLYLALATLGIQLVAWICTGPVLDHVHKPPVQHYALHHGLVMGFFVLLTLSAALHTYDDRRGNRVYVQRYRWMREVFARALHVSERISGALAANAPHADDTEKEKGLKGEVAKEELAKYRQLLLDTGIESLQETAQWILLHRDRPVEPGGH